MIELVLFCVMSLAMKCDPDLAQEIRKKDDNLQFFYINSWFRYIIVFMNIPGLDG